MRNVINIIILISTLLLASYFDIKFRKIPNKLTFPVILWGLISAIIISGFKEFQFSFLGFVFGIAVFFIPFALNMIGGGDVKLMGAIGALMGWRFSLSAVLYSAVAGGIIVIIISLFNKKLVSILLIILGTIINPLLKYLYSKTSNISLLKLINYFESIKVNRKKEYIPYGVVITIGTFLVLSKLVPQVL